MKRLIAIVGFLALIVFAAVLWLSNDREDDPGLEQTTEGTRTYGVPPATDAHDEHGVDAAAPNEMITHTAQSVISTLYSFNPAEDDSPHAAMERAKPYLTGRLLQAANNPPENRAVGQSQTWRSWAESGDYVTASAAAGNVEMNGENEGTVTVWARQSVMGEAGMIPLEAFTAEVTLRLVDGVWLAEDYQILEGAPTV